MKKHIIRRQSVTHLENTTLHPVLKRIYEHRAITDMKDLERNLEMLLPYDSLKNIDEAIAVLYSHLQQQHRILIIGDFDADGATSSAVAVSALRSMGAKQVDYLVPNRFEYGYGLTPEIVDVAAQLKQPQLIITVDNGISSIQGVETANAKGIDVIITDHHLQGKELPKAAAIVNPNQLGDTFPSKNLAGVGVIFYVMLALRKHLKEKAWFGEQHIAEPNMGNLLDIVALGTVADVVPLDKNNRILVYQGLQRIRAGKARPGIQALLTIAKRQAEKLTATDLGFAIAPRLNAAGRLDDMSLGIECLLTDDIETAFAYAQQLDELNQERKTIEADMKLQAVKDLEKLQLNQKEHLPLGLCIYDESWHQGVIGILASRIKDKFNRPVIAFAPADNNIIKGSARSISGLHIRDALEAVATSHPHLISKFGGHAMAAGLTLEIANLPAFSQAFDSEVRKFLTADNLQHEIYSDGELSADEFNLDLAEILQAAGPWGQAFPEPLFDGDFTVVSQRLVGTQHLKLLLKLDNEKMMDAIAFNIDTKTWPNHRCQKIRAAFKLDINEFRGVRTVQLILENLEEK